MSLAWETSDTDIEQALSNLSMPNGKNYRRYQTVNKSEL